MARHAGRRRGTDRGATDGSYAAVRAARTDGGPRPGNRALLGVLGALAQREVVRDGDERIRTGDLAIGWDDYADADVTQSFLRPISIYMLSHPEFGKFWNQGNVVPRVPLKVSGDHYVVDGDGHHRMLWAYHKDLEDVAVNVENADAGGDVTGTLAEYYDDHKAAIKLIADLPLPAQGKMGNARQVLEDHDFDTSV